MEKSTRLFFEPVWTSELNWPGLKPCEKVTSCSEKLEIMESCYAKLFPDKSTFAFGYTTKAIVVNAVEATSIWHYLS